MKEIKATDFNLPLHLRQNRGKCSTQLVKHSFAKTIKSRFIIVDFFSRHGSIKKQEDGKYSEVENVTVQFVEMKASGLNTQYLCIR